jgi:acyl-CoA thioesterase FadM
MSALRDQVGWDLKTLERLPFMTFVKRFEIEFIRPVIGDQIVEISSFVRDFIGADAFIECRMTDESGRDASKALMVVAYVDKQTQRSADWPSDVCDLFYEH